MRCRLRLGLGCSGLRRMVVDPKIYYKDDELLMTFGVCRCRWYWNVAMLMGATEKHNSYDGLTLNDCSWQ
jgi:hypothetical protein